jgi:septum formation topological specificity factor MinE
VRKLGRQFERLHLVIAQLRALDTERAAIAEQPDRMLCDQKIDMLRRLRSVGEGGASTLVAEVFCRASRTEGISPPTLASLRAITLAVISHAIRALAKHATSRRG